MTIKDRQRIKVSLLLSYFELPLRRGSESGHQITCCNCDWLGTSCNYHWWGSFDIYCNCHFGDLGDRYTTQFYHSLINNCIRIHKTHFNTNLYLIYVHITYKLWVPVDCRGATGVYLKTKETWPVIAVDVTIGSRS